MTEFTALILGAVQGLTEFLPVSSSGHLVLFQQAFGIREPALLFNVSVHVGTLAAVAVVFHRDIRDTAAAFLREFPHIVAGGAVSRPADLARAIVIGSIPTAVVGLLLKTVADRLFASVLLVGCMLVGTGVVLWRTRRLSDSGRLSVGRREALIVGFVQGLAVIPGISRAGVTIAAGLGLGLSRETATRFSFLLSIPAILGAELIGLLNFSSTVGAVPIFIGSAAAFAVGFAALRLLLLLVRGGRLHLFAPYCWIVGAAVIGLGSI
jgi:undecaprenyl-diphosphatase